MKDKFIRRFPQSASRTSRATNANKSSSRRAPLLISAADLESSDFDTAPLSTTIFARDKAMKTALSPTNEENIDSSQKYSSLKSSLQRIDSTTQKIYAASCNSHSIIHKIASLIPLFLTIFFILAFLLRLTLKIVTMGKKSKKGELFTLSPSLLSQSVKKCSVFIVRIRTMVNEILSSELQQ